MNRRGARGRATAPCWLTDAASCRGRCAGRRLGGLLCSLAQEHLSVRLITRDRAGTYTDGEDSGAPHTIQIADRWHLLRNVGAALEKVLARHHDTIKRAFSRQEEQHEQEHTPVAPTAVVISHAERIHQ